MTLDEFAAEVQAIAGDRGSAAGVDVRRYLLREGLTAPETRFTAYVETMPGSPGVVVDETSPERAIERLRDRLAGGLAAPGADPYQPRNSQENSHERVAGGR